MRTSRRAYAGLDGHAHWDEADLPSPSELALVELDALADERAAAQRSAKRADQVDASGRREQP